jgi:transcriptional regulator with XRE-family HTH domain
MADLERGQRIKELRESRHLTQEATAEALGVTLRGYQEWEAGGGIKWDNVKKVARLYKVDAEFVMNGPKPETPDLLGAKAGQLDRVEMKLDDALNRIAAMSVQLAALSRAVEDRKRRGSAPASRTTGKKRAGS